MNFLLSSQKFAAQAVPPGATSSLGVRCSQLEWPRLHLSSDRRIRLTSVCCFQQNSQGGQVEWAWTDGNLWGDLH